MDYMITVSDNDWSSTWGAYEQDVMVHDENNAQFLSLLHKSLSVKDGICLMDALNRWQRYFPLPGDPPRLRKSASPSAQIASSPRFSLLRISSKFNVPLKQESSFNIL